MSRKNSAFNFESVGSIMPGRSTFDLSYEKKLTCDMGQLIPIMCDEMVPGDVFHVGNEIVVRFQPLVAPMMHEVNCYVHYFFVPYRLLWEDWEDYITGGVNGASTAVLPIWEPVSPGLGTLWDYLGFPLVDPQGFEPMAFPMNAYNLIYNEYYRDQTLISEIGLDNEYILVRAWEKDYFTSALPWQQRGTAPALPISGLTNANFLASTHIVEGSGATNAIGNNGTQGNPYIYSNAGTYGAINVKNALSDNVVNLASATTFNVSDLRLAFQIQRWMERNARAGVRYTEFLKAHYGVAPRDERLQRPEYVGGSKNPVIVSEVLKTSSTDSTSPQGNMAGHGLAVGGQYCGKYHAQEFGLMMGIMSIMPRPAYSQGVDRQWIKKTKYDFYSPEFANLSEQAVYRGELYATANSAENNTVFGYQGRYNELRYKRNMVVSEMRTTFNYWHMSREFSSAPGLNATFINCVPTKRIFAVQAVPGLLVNVYNRIRASRPIPLTSEPGLIDHD